MPEPRPTRDQLPDGGGRAETYRAADKLKGKRAIITGGDSGIGAAAAVLFAREGATSTIAYLPEEESDAQNTKSQVEELGGICHLVALDLVKKENCRRVVEFALEKMDGIDILFNNAACKSNRVIFASLSVLPSARFARYSLQNRSNDGGKNCRSVRRSVGAYLQHQHAFVLLHGKVLLGTYGSGSHYYQ